MRRTRVMTSLVPAALAAMVLAGCSGGEGTSGSGPTILNVNAGGFPESWAPGQRIEAGFLRMPYETLVARARDGEITPVLATEWEETDTALTLTLRENVFFHDGTPFDAAAVKANLEFVRDGATPFAGPLKVIASVDVVDPKTVRLNLAKPTPSLLTTLSTRAAPMASPKALADDSIAKNPVGTGPWAYDSAASTSGTTLAFTRFDKYWGDAPGFETVKLFNIEDENAAAGALTSGQVDVTIAQPEQIERLKQTPGVDAVEYPAIRNNLIFFDRGPGGLFQDLRVRQAACYAMDPEVWAGLGHAETSTQHFQEGEIGYDAAIQGYPTDPQKARDLMAQAGSPAVKGTILATVYNEREIQIYADQMAKAGVQLEVQSVPPPQFQTEWNSGKYPAGLANNDQIHPYEWYTAYFAADAPGNPAGTESPRLKAAADAAVAAGSSEQAGQLWGQVARIISEEALTCSHVVGTEVVAYQSNKVDGVGVPAEAWEPNMINYRDLKPASP